MSKQTNDEPKPYTQFYPGRNFRRKAGQFMFMTFERIGILMLGGAFLLFTLKNLFPYNIGWAGLVYLIAGIALLINLELPAAGTPDRLLYADITRRLKSPFAFNKRIMPIDETDTK